MVLLRKKNKAAQTKRSLTFLLRCMKMQLETSKQCMTELSSRLKGEEYSSAALLPKQEPQAVSEHETKCNPVR